MTNPFQKIEGLWPTILIIAAIFAAGATSMAFVFDITSLPERMTQVEAWDKRQDRRIDSLSVISNSASIENRSQLNAITNKLERIECHLQVLAGDRRGPCL